MQIWNDIVAQAVVGTDKSRQAISEPPRELGAVLSRLDPSNREGHLLATAASIAFYRTAGKLPSTATITPASPAEPDTIRPVSERSAAHLEAILEKNRSPLLEEWLRLAAAAGRRVPDALLPRLLDRAASTPAMRAVAMPVIGRRGGWLASLNPDWKRMTISAENDREIWQTGTIWERCDVLARVRRADPAEGRRMLEACWEQESYEEKARLLRELRHGLSVDDEPFLEHAHDDRRKEVRSEAVELLMLMTDSGLSRRMLERADRYVQLASGWRRKLQISLPEEVDREMRRDGIEAKPSVSFENMGERAWWLAQILGAVQPDALRRHWNIGTKALVDLSIGSEWNAMFRNAWARAAIRFGDVELAEAMAADALGNSRRDNKTSPLLFIDSTSLFRVLPDDRREEIVIESLDRNMFASISYSSVITEMTHPWSEKFTLKLLEFLKRRSEQKDLTWTPCLDTCAAFAFPEIDLRIAGDKLKTGDPADPQSMDTWVNRQIDEFVETLRFRREMRSALRP